MITRATLSTIEQGLPKYRSMLAGNSAYMPPAYESIATATGTGSNTTLSFTSIPSTFNHLQIRLLSRASSGSSNNAQVNLRFNSDTGGNYTRHQLRGDGSNVGSFGNFGLTAGYITTGSAGNNALSNTMGVAIIDIIDYTSTTKTKTVRSLTGLDLNSADGQILFTSSLWVNTNAITSIDISHNSGETFSSTTVAALYGIKGA